MPPKTGAFFAKRRLKYIIETLYSYRKTVRNVSDKKKDLLQFNVSQLQKEQGGASRNYTIENAILPGLAEDIVQLTPLVGKLKLVKAGNDILVTGMLTLTAQLSCTRCLSPVETSIDIDIEETFTPTRDVFSGAEIEQPEDVDAATIIDELHVLDLTEVVRQNLYLSQPSQILCTEDCRGLCPYCGKNKNEEPCDCEDNQIDNRWAGLLALKND